MPTTRLGAGDASPVEVGLADREVAEGDVVDGVEGSGDGSDEVAEDVPEVGETPGLAAPPALPPVQAVASAATRTARTRGKVAIPQSESCTLSRHAPRHGPDHPATVRAWPTSS
jgi:hypothetical protein